MLLKLFWCNSAFKALKKAEDVVLWFDLSKGCFAVTRLWRLRCAFYHQQKKNELNTFTLVVPPHLRSNQKNSTTKKRHRIPRGEFPTDCCERLEFEVYRKCKVWRTHHGWSVETFMAFIGLDTAGSDLALPFGYFRWRGKFSIRVSQAIKHLGAW